jgi:hypothetical protein
MFAHIKEMVFPDFPTNFYDQKKVQTSLKLKVQVKVRQKLTVKLDRLAMPHQKEGPPCQS